MFDKPRQDRLQLPLLVLGVEAGEGPPQAKVIEQLERMAGVFRGDQRRRLQHL